MPDGSPSRFAVPCLVNSRAWIAPPIRGTELPRVVTFDFAESATLGAMRAELTGWMKAAILASATAAAAVVSLIAFAVQY